MNGRRSTQREEDRARARRTGPLARRVQRWDGAPDPTAGSPLDRLDDLAERVEGVITPDGARLAVVAAGPVDGPLVVLAHCWTGDRRVWGPVARRLVADGHRVVLYDHRGHGRSSTGTAELSLELLGDDLALVLDHVDARRAVVAGHSMGGMAVQAMAGRHPALVGDRLTGALLVATASTAVATGRRARFGPRVVAHPRVERMLRRPVVGPLSVRDFVGATPCLAHLRAVTETFVATPGHVRGSLLRAMATMDLTAGLAALRVPVTVVVGSRDRHTPPAAGRRIADAVPTGRFVEVPDAGHMLPFEVPDLLARLIAAHSATNEERSA